MRALASLLAGLIFGAGLIVAGMTNPAKVVNFLDVAGTWDPSLAFVMGGAVVVTFLGYRLAWRWPAPLLGHAFVLPTLTAIDRRVLVGPAVFGVGWGLAGLCPGPALTTLTLGGVDSVTFVLAMLLGMWAARALAARPVAAVPGRGA